MSKKRNKGVMWRDEELILAYGLYLERKDENLTQSHPAVIALSDLLRIAPYNASIARDDSYRPPDGVRSRISNFRRLNLGDNKNVPKNAIKIWQEYKNNLPSLFTRREGILRDLELNGASQTAISIYRTKC